MRIVHLGVGNFFRAHQAWYAEQANAQVDPAGPSDPQGSEKRWGIAAFTGRSATVADQLAGQDGLYTLVIKGQEGNDNVVISSLSAVHPSSDLDAWRGYLADPQVALVTSTVTEAGYLRSAQGGLDLAADSVAADLAALRDDPTEGAVTTAPGKLVAGLLARRARAGGGPAPIAIVPCDNVPSNGEMVRRVVTDLADAVDASLPAWVADNVSFVTTMVDRITPRGTDSDAELLLEQTGVSDPALVVTEPFTEWVLQGDFPAGRPAWEAGGARFVDDVELYEQRKLWLLNGSHSLMAYAGSILGHETVCEAIGDERVRGWVEQWWDDAVAHIELPADELHAYREELVARYENPNIRHLLAQIAADGSQKIAIRIVPALRAARAAGELPHGATRAIAAWTLHLRGLGASVTDAHASTVQPFGEGSLDESVAKVLGYLEVDDDAVRDDVIAQAQELAAAARPH